ncbi:MAG TPA: GNAT family N-acetyltransferase [Firmicutes bacterium]|nr:GNAT family N-acetyltransferase [Bacillota bacterium]
MESGTYEEWLQKIRADLDIANVQLDRVPSFTYFYVRRNDGEIVGMINIRLFLNDFLKREGGHVGYSIRPSERRKGFATRMLKEMGLSIMKKSRLV